MSSPSRPGAKAARAASAAAPSRTGWHWGWLVGGGAAVLAIAAVLWQAPSRQAASPPPVAERPVPAPAAPAMPPQAQSEQEVVFWESVRNSNSRAELEAYLARYPSGTFTPIARARLEALVAAEAKREAEAKRAADERRAAEQRRGAEARSQVAAAPVQRAAPASTRWQAAMTCEAFEERAAWSGAVDVVMNGGVLVLHQGVGDAPGSWTLRGTPAADGRLQLIGTGVSAIARSRGRPYAGSLDGRLEGDRYELAGRLGARHCTLSIPRTDPAGGRGIPTVAPPAPGALAAQRWQGALACEALAGSPAFNTFVEVSVGGTEFVLQRGTSGEPGSWILRGSPAADGTLNLLGAGISGLERNRGKPYAARFDGKFAGDHYLASGRLGTRPCTLSIARAGRVQ